jgi:hypothetical protein
VVEVTVEERAAEKAADEKALTAYIVTRAQRARGGYSGFRGPDCYMAVVTVPEGEKFDPVRTPLNTATLGKRGIQVYYIEEFYGWRLGPGSRFAKGLKEAQALIARKGWRLAPNHPEGAY